MKPIFNYFLIALSGFIIIHEGVAIANPDSTVQVSMSNHRRVTLRIRGNGALSYEDLPGIDITGALIHDNEHATCFFHRDLPSPSDNKWISDIIKYQRPLVLPFEKADRLFCYDSSFELNNENSFTLFLENREKDKEKISLLLDEGQGFVELSISQAYPNFSVGLRVAVLSQPKPPYMNSSDFPGCFIKLVGQDQFPLRYHFSLRFPSRTSYNNVEKIVCFRSSEETEVRQRWIDDNFLSY